MADTKEKFQAAGIANIICAVWLMIAPFLMRFTGLETATANSLLVGAAMLLVALYDTFMPLHHPGLVWVNFVLGLWLLVAPFLLGFSQNPLPTLTHIAIGEIVVGLAAGSAIGARWTGGEK